MRLLRTAACCAALLALASRAGITHETLPSGERRSVAELGVELPTLAFGYGTAHNRWAATRDTYYSSAVMHDIRDNLHLTYVRTGWVPGLAFKEGRRPWLREDQSLDAICSAGLHLMIIVPAREIPSRNAGLLASDVTEFFKRYTQRNPGCIRWAELANEADIPKNGLADVDAYAAYYEKIAPIPTSFGIPVITSGLSGKDLPWTSRLASLLRSANPQPPIAGYGFHPYGVPVAALA